MSVSIIAVHNIIEVSLFFGCQKYNWPCTLTFRIIFVIHDFAWFIRYAINVYYTFDIACCVLFFVTTSIGIAILVLYSRFPKYGTCCPCCCPPLPQPQLMMMNGQVVQVATIAMEATPGPNQQHQAMMQPTVMQPIPPASAPMPVGQPLNYENTQ